MNNLVKKFLPFMLVGFLFISCAAPPKNAETKNALPWIESILVKVNSIKDNKKEFHDLLKSLNKSNEVLAFYKDSEINIYTKKAESDSFIQTTDSNSILVTKSFYLTKSGTKTLISFDKENWIVLGFDRGMHSRNFDFNYNIEPKLNPENNKLDIYYSLSLDLKKDYKTVSYKNNKKIIEIEKNVVVFDGKIKKFINLNKNILYIPENTSISGNLEITGNIVEAKTSQTNVSIKSLKDVFVYTKNRPFSFSFDDVNWKVSLFPFKIKPSFEIKSTEDKNIVYGMKLNLTYN